MKQANKSVEVHLGRQGRIVIPSALRQSLNLHEGDKLIIRSESGRLILEKQEMVQKRLKERFKQVDPQRSLAKELIDERREAASKEIFS